MLTSVQLAVKDVIADEAETSNECFIDFFESWAQSHQLQYLVLDVPWESVARAASRAMSSRATELAITAYDTWDPSWPDCFAVEGLKRLHLDFQVQRLNLDLDETLSLDLESPPVPALTRLIARNEKLEELSLFDILDSRDIAEQISRAIGSHVRYLRINLTRSERVFDVLLKDRSALQKLELYYLMGLSLTSREDWEALAALGSHLTHLTVNFEDAEENPYERIEIYEDLLGQFICLEVFDLDCCVHPIEAQSLRDALPPGCKMELLEMSVYQFTDEGSDEEADQ